MHCTHIASALCCWTRDLSSSRWLEAACQVCCSFTKIVLPVGEPPPPLRLRSVTPILVTSPNQTNLSFMYYLQSSWTSGLRSKHHFQFAKSFHQPAATSFLHQSNANCDVVYLNFPSFDSVPHNEQLWTIGITGNWIKDLSDRRALNNSVLTLRGLVSQMCDTAGWSLFKLTTLTNLGQSSKGYYSSSLLVISGKNPSLGRIPPPQRV